MTWTVRISYRNDAGDAYETCCEIRVVRLPLEIRSAVIPCAQAGIARGALGQRQRQKKGAPEDAPL
jgi:hypothetical protein